MAMDLPSGAIWGSVRRTIRPMLSMPKRAPKSVAERTINRAGSFLRSIANLLEGITIMASPGKGERTPPEGRPVVLPSSTQGHEGQLWPAPGIVLPVVDLLREP